MPDPEPDSGDPDTGGGASGGEPSGDVPEMDSDRQTDPHDVSVLDTSAVSHHAEILPNIVQPFNPIAFDTLEDDHSLCDPEEIDPEDSTSSYGEDRTTGTALASLKSLEGNVFIYWASPDLVNRLIHDGVGADWVMSGTGQHGELDLAERERSEMAQLSGEADSAAGRGNLLESRRRDLLGEEGENGDGDGGEGGDEGEGEGEGRWETYPASASISSGNVKASGFQAAMRDSSLWRCP